MANNWKYFQVTGYASPAQYTTYVDSHNGNDVTGDGSHDNPFQTIQKAIDFGVCDLVLAGTFEGIGVAGDFSGTPLNVRSIIAEGVVTFDGTGITTFGIGSYGFNYNTWNTRARRNYGTFLFKNYTAQFQMTTTSAYAFDCIFDNCSLVFTIGYFAGIQDILVINSQFGNSGTGCRLNQYGEVRNVTLINSQMISYEGSYPIKNCYFDATSSFSHIISGFDMDFNFFEGTLTNKIRYGGVYYDDIEALQLAHPTQAVNDLPSTTLPLLNQVNDKDFTLQETSPLKDAGDNGRQIGYGKVAKTVGGSDVTWTTLNIDNTTTPGEAILSGSPTGSMTSGGIELFPKARKVTRINLPDFEFNSPLGEMFGNASSDNTPYLLDVELQYSTDNITYNDTWLRMAVGIQPKHDTVNDVGTDDPSYDIDNAVNIVCRYMKFRITMRDNEKEI